MRLVVLGALVLGAGSCRPAVAPYQVVTITTREYAYGVPRTLQPGLTRFRMVNEGTVRHEFQLFRFSPGISADSALQMLARDDIPDAAADPSGGILVGAAGETVRQELLDSLVSGGVYGLLCEFHDSAGAPPHAMLGMYAVLTVD